MKMTADYINCVALSLPLPATPIHFHGPPPEPEKQQFSIFGFHCIMSSLGATWRAHAGQATRAVDRPTIGAIEENNKNVTENGG